MICFSFSFIGMMYRVVGQEWVVVLVCESDLH
jgi:hypothetical protein